ncbi:MAG: DMT family transporter [Pseudomonadota bacterium]
MSTDTTSDSSSKAIAFLMLGISGGLGLDLCAKWLLQTYPLEQFVLIRSAVGLSVFLMLASRFGGFRSLKTRRWGWHLVRSALAVGAMFGFFYGLSKMPLVNALTLGFTAPLMVTALSVPALGESVGWRRWTAVVIGFIGVLIMLRPGVQPITVADLSVLLAAFCYAALAITARKLADTESSYSMAVYVVWAPLLVSIFLLEKSTWVVPDFNGWMLFLLAGTCSVIAWIGIIGGYRRAPPAMLAPFEYTALIGGAIAGYLIWEEIPDRWVVTGATIIIASGLFVVYREIGHVLSSRYLRVMTTGIAAVFRRQRPREKN